ncbi:helix-turn-helix domain-containing protein [Desulfofundulus luciae]|nr:helix-turn-helix transcriptional regulator [Desulfofundulus luciae]
MEKICAALNCQPGDLFECIPDNKAENNVGTSQG